MSQTHHLHCQTISRAKTPAENFSICSGTSSNKLFQSTATTAGDLLNSFLATNPLPGLRADQSRKRFLQRLSESWEQHSIISALSTQKISGSADPHGFGFDPWSGILENYQKGKFDESIWLAFISIHFGLVLNTIRAFYGKFGEGRWDWQSVANNPDEIRLHFRMNRERLKLLKFGNHRKRESNDPDKTVGTPSVIRSFVTW
jgi:Alpha-glutamyl/putrescinyl thymine pyrophosphorylase clade 3